MFPFPVIVIGVTEQRLSGLRQELAQASATVEADYGNADSVVQALSDEKIQKRLFVVGFDSPADAVVLVKLAKAFRNWPILALVGGSQQAENLILANRSGAVQVVAAPIQSLDLRSALNSIAISYRPAEQDCRVVAFTGSVAGCGTTTIATNAAYEIATLRQRQTVLIELASQMGVVAINLGIETPRTLEGILADEEHLDAELVKSSLVSISDHLRILAASGNMVHGGGSITVDGACAYWTTSVPLPTSSSWTCPVLTMIFSLMCSVTQPK